MSDDEDDMLEVINKVIKLEEKTKMMDDIKELSKQNKQFENNIKVLTMKLEDAIPKRNAEDDPCFSGHSDFKSIVKHEKRMAKLQKQKFRDAFKKKFIQPSKVLSGIVDDNMAKMALEGSEPNSAERRTQVIVATKNSSLKEDMEMDDEISPAIISTTKMKHSPPEDP